MKPNPEMLFQLLSCKHSGCGERAHQYLISRAHTMSLSNWCKDVQKFVCIKHMVYKTVFTHHQKLAPYFPIYLLGYILAEFPNEESPVYFSIVNSTCPDRTVRSQSPGSEQAEVCKTQKPALEMSTCLHLWIWSCSLNTLIPKIPKSPGLWTFHFHFSFHLPPPP